MARTALLLLASLATFWATAIGAPNIDDDYQFDESYDYKYDDDDSKDEGSAMQDQDMEKENVMNVSNIKILTKPAVVDVDLGTTIRLPCILSNKPELVQILWERKSPSGQRSMVAMGKTIVTQELLNNNRAHVEVDSEGSTLFIGTATATDAGEYVCSIAIPNQPMEVTHKVNVRAQPVITSDTNAFIEAKKGMAVKLNCQGSGNPPPTIRWSKVGPHDRKLPGGKSEMTGDEIILTNVGRKEAGTYRCTASNGFGPGVTKDFEVKVLYSPEIEVEEVFIHTKEGNKVDLVCNVHGFPRPAVTWKKNGQPFTGEGNSRVSVENAHSKHMIMISAVEREDYGAYSCHASNRLGSAHETVELSALAAGPEFRSSPHGQEETNYLVEWVSMSFTPVQRFKLEYRQEDGLWSSIMLDANEDGTYHYAGKHYLNNLTAASRYEAKVSAMNAAGWNKPKVFYFASKGAEPRTEGVSSGGDNAAGYANVVFTTLIAIVLSLNTF